MGKKHGKMAWEKTREKGTETTHGKRAREKARKPPTGTTHKRTGGTRFIKLMNLVDKYKNITFIK